jgi:hypothetical protein
VLADGGQGPKMQLAARFGLIDRGVLEWRAHTPTWLGRNAVPLQSPCHNPNACRSRPMYWGAVATTIATK